MVFKKAIALDSAAKRIEGICEILAINEDGNMVSLFTTLNMDEVVEKYMDIQLEPGKEYEDFIALFPFDEGGCTYDVFYHLLNVESDMTLKEDVRNNIVKDVLAYRNYCISQYVKYKKAVNVHNAKKFLNTYADAIKVFNLHGDTPKQRKPYLRFIDECWKFINTIK